MDDNTQSWMDFGLRPYDQGGLGLQRHQVAGLLGNLIRESGAGLPSWGPTGDNGTAHGTAQWRGDRLQGLQNYAASNGMDPHSVDAQQAWMRQELSSTHAGAYDALRAAQTPEQAATAFNRRYEISADNTGGREASARAIMDGTDPLGAIDKAAGITNPAPSQGALSFSGDPASAEDAGDGGGALSQPSGSGGVLFQGEGPNKLQTLGAMMSHIAASLAGITNPAHARALQEQAKGIEAQAGSKYQYQMGANGQLVRINKEDGTVDSREIPGASKETFKPVMGKDDNGNPAFVGTFNATTGEYKPIGGGSAGASSTPIGGDPELTGQERYDSLTMQEKKQIDAWRNGTGIQPSQYALSRNNQTKKMVDAANAIGIDMTKYGERQAFLKGMASKSPTTAGGQFISAPTVMDHLLNVANDYTTLGNSSGGGYSTGASIANYVKDLRGGTQREAQQTSTDRNSDTASKEIVSFLTRGHGGVSERQDTHDKLYMPRAAPEVQAAALEAYRKQVADRFYELSDGAKGSVGEDHPELLKAEAAFKAKDAALQQKIAQLRKGQAQATPAPAQAAAPQAPGGTKPPLASFFN